ncbi:MAG: hypothetical protein BJ554DRAFT_4083 [Olpidium bornovanus]|uniref:Uncharacterized protein n=1 Tax=Olpidium bornovanus TaxID=278681 RepID=A0A8H7ZN89_9FUNG|nr:MAG: hypothetical protein BJ554DRAFT_4083 [Olpidium bornovanus]
MISSLPAQKRGSPGLSVVNTGTRAQCLPGPMGNEDCRPASPLLPSTVKDRRRSYPRKQKKKCRAGLWSLANKSPVQATQGEERDAGFFPPTATVDIF